MGDELSQPVTKGEFDAGLAALKSELKTEVAGLKDELIEAIRDSQTEVLRAFERYSAGEHIKFRRLILRPPDAA